MQNGKAFVPCRGLMAGVPIRLASFELIERCDDRTYSPKGKPCMSAETMAPIEIAPATTEVGSYFISNYPPFSLWNREDVTQIRTALASSTPDRSVPWGYTCTFRFVASAASFVISESTQTRTRTRFPYVEALARKLNCSATAGCRATTQVCLFRWRNALVSQFQTVAVSP